MNHAEMSGPKEPRQTAVTLELPVAGMRCAGCVAHVEKALRSLPQAHDVVVNLAAGRAVVRSDASPLLATTAAVNAVEQAGYKVPQGTTELTVRSMHCASCVARVERALQGVPGVLDATVNLASGAAAIDRFSGRTPMNPAVPFTAAGFAAVSASESRPGSASSAQAYLPPAPARTGRRFIAGDPTNSATKRFLGRS